MGSMVGVVEVRVEVGYLECRFCSWRRCIHWFISLSGSLGWARHFHQRSFFLKSCTGIQASKETIPKNKKNLKKTAQRCRCKKFYLILPVLFLSWNYRIISRDTYYYVSVPPIFNQPSNLMNNNPYSQKYEFWTKQKYTTSWTGVVTIATVNNTNQYKCQK